MNRCILLTSNISREQTQAIHKLQRQKETLSGMLQAQERERIIKLHQNAQRLLKPVMVVNPYAEKLTFMDSKLRTRRDHAKYLTLIKTIALLHQYQRPPKKASQRPPKKASQGGQAYEYIEVTLDDIALANKLASEVMGMSLDELAPQTRKMLGLIQELVKKSAKNQGDKEQGAANDRLFTRRQVREFTGWSNTQVRLHLDRLRDMEYILVHKGSGQGQQYVYELVYNGEGDHQQRFLMGLLDVNQLRHDDQLGHRGTDFTGGNANFTGVNG